MSNTATVEALTAEVRALMIGKRQVTLSVYRQLDEVDYSEIEPFGRVRDSKFEAPGRINVVGKRVADGALVRSFAPAPSWATIAPTADFDHWALHAMPKVDRIRVREADGHALVWLPERGFASCHPPRFPMEWPKPPAPDSERDLYQRMRAEHQVRCDRGDFCNLPSLKAKWEVEADADLETTSTMQSVFDSAQNLPLIVLAGLR